MLQERKSREKYMANVKQQLDELHGRVRHRRERRKDEIEERFSKMPQERDTEGSETK